MGQAGKYLRRVGSADGHTAGGFAHWCPACKEMHAFAVDAPFRNGARWSFDGNLDAPTFAPSMNIRIGPYLDNDEGKQGQFDVCHYFLRAGKIQFLDDCTHSMRGQTVPLPELPLGHRDKQP